MLYWCRIREHVGATSNAALVILPLLTVALHAGLTTCNGTPGCADYIRAGIGYTSTVVETAIEVATVTTQTITVTGGTGAANGDLAAASACSSSWSSYSSRQSKNVVVTKITTTFYNALTTNITYGTGDVYSTAPGYGIPIARDNFTATSTGQRVYNITSTQIMNVDKTLNTTLAKATPTCSLITPDECSKLYVSYIASLGLPKNASVPDITPAPANSPPCPTYYYKPFSSCSNSFVTSYPNDCTIMGNSVKLFYFPSQTTTSTETVNVSATITAPPKVVYEYAPGTTFTSPSIYLKFDYLSAERLSQGNDAVICSVCDKNGCRETGVDGGQERNVEGTSIEGQLVTLAPEEVSSIVLNYNEQEASSIVSTMALNLPGYADVMNDIVGNHNVTAKPLRIEDVLHPPPEAYYLQPLDNAPGCGLSVPQPQCSTIFEGAYRALISLPHEVTGFQGSWKSCFPVIYGVYDPPIALTRASTADGATLPNAGGYRTSTNGGQAAQTPQTAVPANLPNTPTQATPTAQADNVPGQNGNGGNAGPTLPASGGSSNNNGGSNNGGSNNGASGNGGNTNGQSGSGSGSENNNGGSGTGAGSGNNNENSGSNGGSAGNSGNTGGSGSGSPPNNDASGSGSGSGSPSNNNVGGSGTGSGDTSISGGGSSGNNGGGSSNNDGAALILPGTTLLPGTQAVVSGTTYSLPLTGAGAIFINGQSTSLPSANDGSPVTLPNGVVATVASNNNAGGTYIYVDNSGSTHVITGPTTYVDSHGSTHTVASRTTTRRPSGTGSGTGSSGNGDTGTATGTTSLASSASQSIATHMSSVVFVLALMTAHALVT